MDRDRLGGPLVATLLLVLAAGCMGESSPSTGPSTPSPAAAPSTPSSPTGPPPSPGLSPSTDPAPSAATVAYDPFEDMPYTMAIPRGWIAVSQPTDWSKAVAAYDSRFPGDLAPDHAFRGPVGETMPDMAPGMVVALRTDGPVLNAWQGNMGTLTPEMAVELVEVGWATAFGEMAYGPSPPPDLRKDITRLTLPAGPAVEVELAWTETDGSERGFVGYLVLAREQAYFVTVMFEERQAAAVMPEVTTMLDSFMAVGG